MGLVLIVASFLVMVVGALPLAAASTGAGPAVGVVGLFTFGAGVWLFVRSLRVAVIVTPEGLEVRNLVTTHRMPWPTVGDVRPRLVGGGHVLLAVRLLDAVGTEIDILATRTVLDGSGVRLVPLLAVLDVHAASDDITVDHRLPDGSLLPGSPARH